MGKSFYFFWSAILFINLLFLTTLFAGSQRPAVLLNPVTVKASAFAEEQTPEPETGETSQREYHILLLGLDGRKGDVKPRCDAIHIFSFSPRHSYLLITSLPRGTKLNPQAEDSMYLANSCSINGIDFTVNEIERITQLKIDAVVKVGFSQVLGILRTLNMPTTSTLQFLRSRRYTIGDNQRSRNQAMFFKDVIINHFEDYYNLPAGLKSWLFKTVEADITYDQAEYLLESIYKNKVYQQPENIILISLPYENHYLREIHLPDNAEGSSQDNEFIEYQANLSAYLKKLIAQSDKLTKTGNIQSAEKLLTVPYHQKLWLQLENDFLRREIYFHMMKTYADAVSDRMLKKEIISDYLEEMSVFGDEEYLSKGKAVLTSFFPDSVSDGEGENPVN
ncbi:MAG: hypothetical protein UV73_C0004G0041 [Candidatus Gottesmanbacteria bacterium GW2011_GWA2_43_14]|uniref:Cell envelope-related transcriptional attenuator n=1 Tax=Candidatus Gottesmanbacteria bacterium GW2011_GWA2_43_14 TaxID=1618443 RepID=A0A0G1DJQ5_9BACT|nr:MAG: hypothetical protein UV73_C0004G0041 [Candidatus Gottesmanbacteria bacterium GW2011_GWA2_43_14]